MTGADGDINIDCPLGIFAAYERTIRRLTEEINHATTGPAKAKAAKELQAKVLELMSCDGEAANVNCTLCREFSRLRNQMATLVVNASRVAR
jgi:hypothetical protein